MPNVTETLLYIGMISGTSRDGVDTALVSFANKYPKILYSMCAPYPPDLADSLKDMIDAGQRPGANELEKMPYHYLNNH